MFQSETEYEREKVTKFFIEFSQDFNSKIKNYAQLGYFIIFVAENEI